MTNMYCRFGWSALWLLAVTFLVSCAGVPQQATGGRKFHEEAAADVILRHYRWEHINLTHPEFREDGYLVTLSRSSLGPAFDRLHVKRDLAVVVFGRYYTVEQLGPLTSEWVTLLRQQGFKRVVCVHGGGEKSVDGLPIIEDTKSADEAPRQTASL